MSHIVADIQSFAETNNMELNPSKCKDMIVDFLHFNANVFKPIVIGFVIISLRNRTGYCIYAYMH